MKYKLKKHCATGGGISDVTNTLSPLLNLAGGAFGVPGIGSLLSGIVDLTQQSKIPKFSNGTEIMGTTSSPGQVTYSTGGRMRRYVDGGPTYPMAQESTAVVRPLNQLQDNSAVINLLGQAGVDPQLANTMTPQDMEIQALIARGQAAKGLQVGSDTEISKLRSPSTIARYREHASGGQLDNQLNSSAFQVQGNPSQVDGNNYTIGNDNVALDNNEVVKDNFVFSDRIKNPITGNTFAKDSKTIEKSTGKAEKKTQRYGDLISKNTLKWNQKNSDSLRNIQETLATTMGLRDESGNTVQHAAMGGKLGYEWGGPNDPLPNQPYMRASGDRYYDPYKHMYLVRDQDGLYTMANTQPTYPRQREFNEEDNSAIDSHLNRYPPQTQSTSIPPVGFDPTGNLQGSSSVPGAMLRSDTPGTIPEEVVHIDPKTGQYHNIPKTTPIVPGVKTRVPGTIKTSTDKARTPVEGQPMSSTIDNGSGISIPTGANTYADTSITPFSKLPIIRNREIVPHMVSPLPLRNLQMQENIPGAIDPLTGEQLPGSYSATNPNIPSILQDYLNRAAVLGVPTSGRDTNGIPKDTNYHTPFTVGDALQGGEVLSKFLGLLGGPEKEKVQTDNTPITKESFDPRSQLYSQHRALQNYLDNANTTRPSIRNAIFNQGYASKVASEGETLNKYQQMNNAANTQYEQRLADRRRYNIGQQSYTNDINARNRGAFNTQKDTALTSLGNFGEQLNKKVYANDSLALLKKLYPNAGKVVNEGLSQADLLKLLKLNG